MSNVPSDLAVAWLYALPGDVNETKLISPLNQQMKDGSIFEQYTMKHGCQCVY